MGYNVPPHPHRAQELAAALLGELRQLRAVVPEDLDLQAAEKAAQDCAARLGAYAARLPASAAEPSASAGTDGDGEPSPEGYNVPPHPH